MRKRRESNMSLGPEMIRLSDSYYKKRCVTIDGNFKTQVFNLKRKLLMGTRDPGQHFIIAQQYVEWAKEKVTARIETYIDAYRRVNLIPNDGDINEIKWDLEDIIHSVNQSGSVDTEKRLEREKVGIIDAAENELNIFIQEMELESKREPANAEPASGHTFNININENRGLIQQGGEGNIQSTKGRSDEDKQ